MLDGEFENLKKPSVRKLLKALLGGQDTAAMTILKRVVGRIFLQVLCPCICRPPCMAASLHCAAAWPRTPCGTSYCTLRHHAASISLVCCILLTQSATLRASSERDCAHGDQAVAGREPEGRAEGLFQVRGVVLLGHRRPGAHGQSVCHDSRACLGVALLQQAPAGVKGWRML